MVEEAARGSSHPQTEGHRNIKFSADGGDTNLPLFEIALVAMRFDHIASFIVNANHGIM